MASGSSRRASYSGSDVILPSYEGISNPVKEFDNSRVFVFPAATHGTPKESSVNKGVISVENTKKNTDTLSSSHLRSELELYFCNLDKSIRELRSDLSCYRGVSDSKFKSLESHVQEVHRCVQILKDKLELADTQKELAPSSSSSSSSSSSFSSSGGQNEERTSAPSSGPKKGTETPSDRHNHQQPQQVAPPPQPSLTKQPTTQTQTPEENQQGPQPPVQSLSAQNGPVGSKVFFFWELITNSIRALEKVKAEESTLDHETKLQIHVDLNKAYKTMSFIDNGIGMTKADLEKELCTKDGMRGVLRTDFLAANKVVVTTKHNDEDEQYVCEASRGDDNRFKFIDRDNSETSSLGRGTKITLFLEDDHHEFLDECYLEKLVDRFFKYIDYHITIRNYNSSNKYYFGLVHFSRSKPKVSGWFGLTPLNWILEKSLLKHFPNEVNAWMKKNEKKSCEEKKKGKKKGLEILCKVMEKVLAGEKVDEVVVVESSVFPKKHFRLSEDPKTKKVTAEINPWEPNGIVENLAELAAEDSEKYYKVLEKMILKLFVKASFSKPLHA